MPETLTLGDEEITVTEANKLFAQAMAAPEPTEEAAPSPKRRQPAKPSEDKPEHSRPRVSTGGPQKRAQAKPKAASAAPPKDFTEDLQSFCQLAYGTMAATGNLADAGAVKAHGPQMCVAWNAVAQENARVRKSIEWLVSGGVWGAVLMSTMPFALQIAANHKQIAVEKVAALGVKDPEVLAKETEADIVQMAQMAQA